MHHFYAVWWEVFSALADVACVDDYTFTVVWEMEQKGLETAGVWSILVPDDFTEQDDSNIVLNLKVQMLYNRYFKTIGLNTNVKKVNESPSHGYRHCYLLECMCFICLYLMFCVFY